MFSKTIGPCPEAIPEESSVILLLIFEFLLTYIYHSVHS